MLQCCLQIEGHISICHRREYQTGRDFNTSQFILCCLIGFCQVWMVCTVMQPWLPKPGLLFSQLLHEFCYFSHLTMRCNSMAIYCNRPKNSLTLSFETKSFTLKTLFLKFHLCYICKCARLGVIITRCFMRRGEDVTGGLSQPSPDRVLFSFSVMLKTLSYINFPPVTDRAAHLHFKPLLAPPQCAALHPATNRVYMR